MSSQPMVGFDLESIGTIMPALEVKVDPETSEILIKGPTVTTGYYNNPEANAEAFTEDGFFRTGDAGRMENGVLYFKERIKDLFKTANGKYIARSIRSSSRSLSSLTGISSSVRSSTPTGRCCAVRLPSVACLVTSAKRSSASSMRCTAS